MSPSRPSVLLIAELANPDWVSLPLVGWGHSRALHDRVRVHLVTAARNREGIEKQRVPGLDVTFVENRVGQTLVRTLDRLTRRDRALDWTMFTAFQVPEYILFEREVWRRFGDRLRAREFDVVHRLTPMSPVIPSYLAHKLARIGVPFVVGPVNGGLPWPKELAGRRVQQKDRLSPVRDAAKLMPYRRSTWRDASAILVAAGHTLKDIPPAHRHKCFWLPEVGIFPERITASREGPVQLPLRVAFVGRLIPLKAVDLLVRAAAPLIRAGDVVVEVMGDGPARDDVERASREEGVEAGVVMHGWVSHHELADKLSRCDVLGFPSLRELGGGAVVEAMAMGLVPIVLRYGGPGEVVLDAFGFRVPIGSEATVVGGIRRALEALVADPGSLIERRTRARQWALGHFTWQAKSAKTADVYDWVLGRAPRPVMPFPD